jgi:hypothetical protein
MPDKKIPELRYLSAHDWLTVANEASFQSETDVRRALSRLRGLGKQRFGRYASDALDRFVAANDGQLPTDTSQLKAYFDVPVDDETLQRYQVVQTGDANRLSDPYVLSERGPVDRDCDSHVYIGQHGQWVSFGTGGGGDEGPHPWAKP